MERVRKKEIGREREKEREREAERDSGGQGEIVRGRER